MRLRGARSCAHALGKRVLLDTRIKDVHAWEARMFLGMHIHGRVHARNALAWEVCGPRCVFLGGRP